jgi:tetratricopeptide (TPR) repeat protein
VNPANFTILGAAYHKAGDVQQAIGHYAQALRLAPDAQAHSNLGTAYYFNEQFAEAADSYRSAIALDATSGTSYRNLADTYLRQNRPADARREYETAIARTDVRLKSKSQDVGLIALKAFCEAKLGRLDDAQRNIAAALTLSKRTSADTLFKSAQINTIAGRADQALRDLEEALSLGYPGTFARDDWELRSLRQIPKFTQLVNGPQK